MQTTVKDDEMKTLLEDFHKITRQYRESALRIVTESGDQDEISSQISEHFLDKLWEEGDVYKKSDSQIVYCCQACGYVLHPGFEGTSLRAKRMSVRGSIQSLRRRQQRKRKSLAMAKQKEAKDVNSLNNRHKKKTAKSDSEADPPPAGLVVLPDDPHLVLDRHHIEIKCGKCKTKTLLKGLKRKNPTTKHELQTKQQLSKTIQTSKTSMSKGASLPNEAEDTSDFLQLPPASSKKPRHESAPMSKAVPNKSIPTFKKKKKKKGSQGNNKLMDFLSSLND